LLAVKVTLQHEKENRLTDTQTIPFHGETGHAAVRVKLWDLDQAAVEAAYGDASESQRSYAWDAAAEEFWSQIHTAAEELGYAGASSEGRSGGWCAPYYGNYQNLTVETFEDRSERVRFAEFEVVVQELLDDVPRSIAEYVAEAKELEEDTFRQFRLFGALIEPKDRELANTLYARFFAPYQGSKEPVPSLSESACIQFVLAVTEGTLDERLALGRVALDLLAVDAGRLKAVL
jgi:hypothetical protein